MLPNPSGLNAHYQPPELARLFRRLRLGVAGHVSASWTVGGVPMDATPLLRSRHQDKITTNPSNEDAP